MRYLLLAVTASLTLTACGGESEAESAPANTTTEAPPSVSDVERQYLADVRSGALLGDYLDDELVALGQGFCGNRREGLDPLADGRPGNGAYEFDDPAVTVYAMDTITIDFSAQEHLCPDV